MNLTHHDTLEIDIKDTPIWLILIIPQKINSVIHPRVGTNNIDFPVHFPRFLKQIHDFRPILDITSMKRCALGHGKGTLPQGTFIDISCNNFTSKGSKVFNCPPANSTGAALRSARTRHEYL
jgi:hypothetical protein